MKVKFLLKMCGYEDRVVAICDLFGRVVLEAHATMTGEGPPLSWNQVEGFNLETKSEFMLTIEGMKTVEDILCKSLGALRAFPAKQPVYLLSVDQKL